MKNIEYFKSILLQIGLLEKESELYVMSLQIGPKTAGFLAKSTGMNRSTAYYMLYNLKEKGLITTFIKNDVLFFHAVNPKKILDLLKEKEDKLSTQKRILKNVLPEFTSITNSFYSERDFNVYKGKVSVGKLYKSIPWGTESFSAIFSPGVYDRSFSKDSYWGVYSLEKLKSGKILISILAGVKVNTLRSYVGSDISIIRRSR